MSHENNSQPTYEQKSLFKLPDEQPSDVSNEEWQEHTAKRDTGYYARIDQWLGSNPERLTRFDTVAHEEPTVAVAEPGEPTASPRPGSEAAATARPVEMFPSGVVDSETTTDAETEQGFTSWGDRVNALAVRIDSLSSTADKMHQSATEKVDSAKRVAKKTGRAAVMAGKITIAVPTLVALSPFIATGFVGYGAYKAGKAAHKKTKEVAATAKEAVKDKYEDSKYKVENGARHVRIGLGRAAMLRFAPDYFMGQAVSKSAEWTQKRASTRVETNRAKQENSHTMKSINDNKRRIEENKNRRTRSNPEQRAA